MAVYRGPGVFAEEIVRSISPSPLPTENAVALISEVPDNTPFRELKRMTGTTPVRLAKSGIVPSSLLLQSRDEFTTYLLNTDYTVTSTGLDEYDSFRNIVRIANHVNAETFTLDSGTRTYKPANGRGVHNITITTTSPSKTYQEYIDWTYDRYTNTLIALDTGTIPRDGTTITLAYDYGIANNEDILVSYRYADDEYYSHKLLNDFSEVTALYGHPWNANGTPKPVCLAAQMIFANGGPDTQVLICPVNPHASDPDNVDKTQVNFADWQLAIEKVNEDEVSMITETSGLADVQGFIIQNVMRAPYYHQTRMAFLGRDYTKDLSGRTQLRAYAEAINNQRVVIVAPTRWEAYDDVNGTAREIGGQYAAAAICGLLSRIRFQDTITRRSFTGLRSKEGPQEKIVMAQDTAAGLTVIENKSGFNRIFHGVTTAFGDVNTREISVVRAKDFMIKSLQEVLDRTVIGMLMEPNVDFLVQTTMEAVLDRMVESYVIARYTQPQVWQNPNEPTQLRTRFGYIPNYPINEIIIEFSINPLGTRSVNA